MSELSGDEKLINYAEILVANGTGVAVLFILLLCGQPCSGTTALAMCVWAACGLQLGAIGVIGEYLGKIYLETKARPRYLIETVLDDDRASE